MNFYFKMKHLFLFFVICITNGVFAQNESVLAKMKLPTFIDTLFIDHDLNNYSVRGYTNYKDNRFRITNAQRKATYAPSNPFGIGIGIATKKLIIDLGLNIKSQNKEPTDRIDFSMTFMFRKTLIDYTFQSYQGYNDLDGSASHFRQDIHSFSSRLNYMYMFNADEQSIGAMKSGLFHQKKSAYSFGLGGFVFINQIAADSALIPTEDLSLYNEQAQITEFSGIGGGVLGGFSVTYPFTQDLFISGSLTSGIGLMYKEVETEASFYIPSNPMLYQANIGTILGYNWSKYYINISVNYGLLSTDLDFGNRIVYNIVNTKLALGYKFGLNKHK